MKELRATIAAILGKMQKTSKSRKEFISHTLILFLSIRGRINFLQLARHSDKYVESSFRNNFEQYFDYASFNTELVLTYGSGHYLAAFDPSFIRKSGKHTPHKGKFWSGCLQKMESGMEAGVLSVVDIDNHTAFHIDAVVSPNASECKDKDITLMDHYVNVILWSAEAIEKMSKYLAVDAYFAKQTFISPIMTKTNLSIITRLRNDADLRYLYTGAQSQGRGAPRKYAGKINLKDPDLSHFSLQYEDDEVRIYDAIVYAKFLKCNIRIAYTQWIDKNGKISAKIYASMDSNLPAFMIVKYYQARFQEEFIFRDGKQIMGLNHCQARSTNKIEFHWNCALTAINVAKAATYLTIPKEKRNAFSIEDVKTMSHNYLLIQQFIAILPQQANLIINTTDISKIYSFGCKAT